MKWAAASSVALSFMLAACGGSGGVNSTPNPPPQHAPAPSPTATPTPVTTPTPTPATGPTPSPTPKPTNKDVADLVTDQTFSTGSAHITSTFDLSAGTTSSSTSSKGRLSIAYDASAKAYTVSSGGRMVTFSPDDQQASDFPGESVYVKSADSSDRLTLTNVGYASKLTTHSVGLGYWQSNATSGSNQDTDFDVFVYGFPTAASQVPRTGSAAYQADFFGFATPVGSEPFSFQGTGTMAFDFEHANFQIDTGFSEYYLVSHGGSFSPKFRATGTIGSAGAFSGNFYYAHPSDPMSGTLEGNFYGPNAQEAGGTFEGTGLPGSSLVGAFTAANGGDVPAGLTLATLGSNTELLGYGSILHNLHYSDPGTPGQALSYPPDGAEVLYKFGGNEYQVSGYPIAFTEADLKSSSGEYNTYETQDFSGNDYTLSILKPAQNGKIELTYSTLAEFYVNDLSLPDSVVDDRTFMALGIVTPDGTLPHTGSATYDGIVLGAAASLDSNRTLSVAGTSQFHIGFADQSYSGWLQLSGTDRTDGSTLDFGRFDLTAGAGFEQETFRTGLTQGSVDGGLIKLGFYGPTGEELGGAFTVSHSNYEVVGATTSVRK